MRAVLSFVYILTLGLAPLTHASQEEFSVAQLDDVSLDTVDAASFAQDFGYGLSFNSDSYDPEVTQVDQHDEDHLSKRATLPYVSSLLRLSKSKVVRTLKGKITWYTGRDLQQPACWRKSRWTPTDRSLVAAVTEKWPGKPKCGSFVKLTARKKSVIVRIVDACAGCKRNSAHFDLTKRAFSSLYNLDVGEVNGVKAQVLAKPPFKKWTKAVTRLYGPKNL